MIDGESEHPEHEMAFDLHRPSDAHEPSAEFVFQASIDPLDHRPEIVDSPVGVGQMDQRPPLGFRLVLGFQVGVGAEVDVDHGNMAEVPAVFDDLCGIVGRVHDVIQISDSLPGDAHERDGDLAVVDGSGGE